MIQSIRHCDARIRKKNLSFINGFGSVYICGDWLKCKLCLLEYRTLNLKILTFETKFFCLTSYDIGEFMDKHMDFFFTFNYFFADSKHWFIRSEYFFITVFKRILYNNVLLIILTADFFFSYSIYLFINFFKSSKEFLNSFSLAWLILDNDIIFYLFFYASLCKLSRYLFVVLTTYRPLLIILGRWVPS